MVKEKSVFWSAAQTAPEEIEATVQRLTDIGFDSVVSPHPPPTLVEALHRAALKCHAEFTCFAGEQLWKDIPSARPVDEHGNLLENEEWYYGANPACEPLRQRKLLELESMLRSADIDGVWLDFIRWPCHWEVERPKLAQTSFDGPTVSRFLAETGIELPAGDASRAILKDHFEAWVDWKTRIITSWVGSAKEVLNRVRPGLPLGLFGVPWLQQEHGGAIRSIIGQDYGALAKHVDVFSPMAYHAMCGRPVSWIADSADAVKAATGKKVLPVVQCVDVPRKLGEEELAQALRAALGSGAGGVMLFELKELLEGGKGEIVKAVFQSCGV